MAETERTLERLRQDARDELAALIDLRCRLGEDPWEFLPDLPSVDQQVVATIREELIHAEDWRGLRARAYHPTARDGDVEKFEFQLLRQISLEHPDLSGAVWSMLGRVPTSW